MFLILVGIFILSLVLAYRSMRDFGAPKELIHFINASKIKGSIVFFKSQAKHYKGRNG